MSTTSNPFERFEELFERMADQFEETARAFDGGESRYALPGTGSPGMLPSVGSPTMAVDLVERDETFVATVDLPGFDRDDVEVRVTDDTLFVEATREEETEMDDEGEMGEKTYLRRERSHESMERTIRLPEPVTADGTEATFSDGVLTVTVPKAEPTSESRRIDVEGR